MTHRTRSAIGAALVVSAIYFGPIVHAQDGTAPGTPSADDLAAIRAEMQAMRAAYEKKIGQLESRIQTLEQTKPKASEASSSSAVARLEGRITELEASQSVATAEREKLRSETEQGKREAEAARMMSERAQNMATDTQTRYRSYEGWPFDPIRLYQLPRPFQFHGYLRAGFGLNSEEGEMVAFKAPGAGAKYRLGNESDTYGEFELVHNWMNRDEPLKKPFVSTHVRLSFSTGENDTYDSLNATDMGNDIALREAYSIGGNVFAAYPDVQFWGGQRYYQRYDVHINDFYYLDTSGYGAGVENIPLGDFAKLHLAWLGGSFDQYETENGDVAKHNFDLRIDGIKVPGGKLMVWGDFARSRGGEVINALDANGDKIHLASSNGWAVGLFHRTPEKAFLNGYNQFGIEYGEGAAYNFATTIDVGSPNVENANHFRIIDHFTIQPAKWFSMQAVALYDHVDYGGPGPSTVDWYSAGIRPIYHFNDRFSVALETGVDWVDNQTIDASDYLYKITLAPQLSRGGEFFSRPVLRAFITYAKWGDGFRGYVGGTPYHFDTEGLSFGVQMESWW